MGRDIPGCLYGNEYQAWSHITPEEQIIRDESRKRGVTVHDESYCDEEKFALRRRKDLERLGRDFGIQARGVIDKGPFRAVGEWRGDLPTGAAANVAASFAGKLRTGIGEVGDGLTDGARRLAVRKAMRQEQEQEQARRHQGQGRGRQRHGQGRVHQGRGQPLSRGRPKPRWRMRV